jgi:uncharacterized protein YqjF (DUF2071 family)
MDRLAPTRRPNQRAQGHQRWHRLLFSHWEVSAALLRPFIPKRLELDAFEGRYYVGAVSFTMQHVRPFTWAPPVPTAREFGEINLRTYVHLDGGEPGVHFFSLDASSALVVWIARKFWGLPYFRAEIDIRDQTENLHYRALRQRPRVEFTARGRVGSPLMAAAEESLEFFLCERYQFYAERRGRLYRARVHHTPYPLYSVHDASVDLSLLEAAGLPIDGARTPNLFSPGVNVEIFPLEAV